MERPHLARRWRMAVCAALLLGTALAVAPASAQDGTWLGVTGNFNDPFNWTPATVPTGRATFDNSGTITDVTVTSPTTLDQIRYSGKAYTLINTSILTIGSTSASSGVSNVSSVFQPIVSTNDLRFVGNAALSGGPNRLNVTALNGNMVFADHSSADSRVAIAGNLGTLTAAPGFTVRGHDLSISFRDSSFADNARLDNLAGSAGANSATNVTGGDASWSFADDSHADGAIITNFGGAGGAQAGTASATAAGGVATLTFTGNSHADHGDLRNLGGESSGFGGNTASTSSTATGGDAHLTFNDDSHGDDSTIRNLTPLIFGTGRFGDGGTPTGTGNAGGAVTLQGSNAALVFNDDSHADRATITNQTSSTNRVVGGVGGAGGAGDGGTGGAATATSGNTDIVFNDDSHADGATIANGGGTALATGGVGGAGGTAGRGGTGGGATTGGGGSNLTLNDNVHLSGATISNHGGDATATGGNGGKGGSPGGGNGGNGGDARATGAAATITLNGNATLGIGTTIDNLGGFATAVGGNGGNGDIGAGGNGGEARATGGQAMLVFNDNSSAGNALITNQAGSGSASGGHGGTGATGSGGSGGGGSVKGGDAIINFNGHSTAGSATITNNAPTPLSIGSGGGYTINSTVISFNDNATGGSAHIVINFGNLNFNDSSIFGTAAGGGAVIDMHGSFDARTVFNDDASLGNGTINTSPGSGGAEFRGNSNAGTGTINVSQTSQVQFFDTASAGGATINNGFFVNFIGSSDASNARIVNGATAQVFAGTSGPLGIGSLSGGGTVSTNPGRGVNVGNLGLTDTFGGRILGGGALTKVGTGTLILTGTNINNGGTTVSGGTLQLGNGGTTGSVVGNITDNANLAFNRSDDLTFGNVISGTGTLTQMGPGALIIAADQTYAGGTFVNGGTLRIGTATQGSIIGNIVDNAILVFGRDDDVTFAGDISGTGSLVKTGGGTLTLTGTNSFTGGSAITGTDLLIGNGGTSGTIAGNIVTSNADVIFNRSDASTFTGAVSGDGALVKNGAGTLILTGANSQTGGTTINAGTLQIGNGAAVGSIVGNVTDDGTLAFNRADTITFGGLVSGTGALVQQGPGTLILTGANSYSGGTVVSGGTLQIGTLTQGSIAGNVIDNAILSFGRDDDVTFAGDISGIGSLVKNGGGTLTLTGTNSFAGGAAITGTDLLIGNGGTSGTIAGNVVTSNANVIFNRSDASTFTGAISGDGALVKNGAGTLILTGANTQTGGTTINAGTLQIGDGGTTGSIAGDIVDNGALVFNRSGAFLHAGNISGTGSLTKAGTGTLVLTAAATQTGGTVIDAGALMIGNGGTTGSVAGDITDNAILAFNRSDIVTFGGVISGAGGLVQMGPGTLVLTGANSYAGGTLISSGILQIGNGGTTGAIVGDIFDDAALVFNRSDDLTFTGNISGTGSLTKTGAGTLTLTGTAAHGGGTTITAGTLQIGNGGATGAIAGDIVDNGALVFNRSGALLHAGNISGTGSLTKTGTGTLVLTGAATQTGGTTIDAGALMIGNGGTAGSVAGDITDNAILAFNRSDIVTFGGVISGAGGLVQMGPGTLILTGANSYTGGTLIAGGATLQIGNGGTTGSIAGNIATNGSLVFDRSDTIAFAGDISGAGTLTQQGAGTLVLTGNDGVGATIAAGTLQVGNGGTTGSVSGDIANRGALVFNRSNNMGYADVVSGTGSLTQAGTGTLVLTNANTYTGGTTIDAGILQVGNGGATGSVGGDIANRGALVFNRSNNMAYADVVSGTGSLTQAGSGTLVLTNANTYSGGTTISAGALQLGGGGAAGSVAGDITDNGILAFNRSDTITFGGVVSGTGALVQMGPGTLILTGANTYTGGTLISAGTLQIGNGGTTGAIAGDVLDNAALVFNRSNDLTFAGNIAGSGSLTKLGAGILTLTGTAAHGGGTTIATGTLQIGNGGATGAIAGDIVDNGALVFNRSGALLYAGNISGTGSLTKTGTGTLILTGASTQTGGTTIAAGAVMIGNGGTTGSVAGDITDNSILAFNRSDVVTFGGVVSGTGGLVQMGPGTLILTNANSYAGGTLISGGILQIGNGGTTGSIMGNVTDNANLTFNRSDTITFVGVISGTGSLSKAGSGVLILTGANSYTGATAVNAGTLELNGRITSNTSIAAAAALRGTGTIAGTLAVNGTVTPGNAASPLGTLIVGGNVTFAAGSVLIPTINSAGGTSLLQGGALTLNGGQVRPLLQPGGLFLIQTDYRIASGSGGRTGAFSGVDETGLPAFLDATMVYTASDAILRLRRNQTNFAANAGLTPNQSAISAALDAAVAAGAAAAFTTYAPIYNSLLMASPGALGQQLDILSGDALAIVPVAAQGAAERFGDRLADHTWSNSSNLWGLIAYADQDVDADGIAPGFKSTGAEIQMGFASSLGADTRLGLSAGWSNGDVNARGRVASAEVDTWSVGARLRHDFGAFYLAGQTSYNWHRIDTIRSLLLAGTATARFDATTWTASGEAGAVLQAGQLSIEPFLRLRHADTRQDAYAETGPAGALGVAAQDYETTRLGGGIRIANRTTAATVLPYAEIGYERESGDQRATLDNDLPGLPAYRVFGTRLGDDILSASVGVEARLGHGVSLFANGGGRWRSRESSLAAHGGVRVVF